MNETTFKSLLLTDFDNKIDLTDKLMNKKSMKPCGEAIKKNIRHIIDYSIWQNVSIPSKTAIMDRIYTAYLVTKDLDHRTEEFYYHVLVDLFFLPSFPVPADEETFKKIKSLFENYNNNLKWRNVMENNLKLILNLFNIVKKIDGERIQKIVYILKNNGVNIADNFHYQYNGAYSSDLKLELDYLVDKKFLKVIPNEESYEYVLNSELDDTLIDNDINRFSDLIIDLNGKDVKILELISTIFYLKNCGVVEKEKIITKVNILKPQLIYYLDDALSYV